MSVQISTAEARQQTLPGSNVFRPTSFMYIDEAHRDWSAVRLNIEAVKAFSDTVAISERDELAAHRVRVQDWIVKGALAAGLQYPWSAADHDTFEYMNYEYLKIACGFELHLKARLVSRGVVLHQLDRSDPKYRTLADEQRERPVSIAEMLAIQDFQFDGKQNFLPGLGSLSLKFSWLTDKPGYRNVLGLTQQQLDIVKDYRALRNLIHLPGDVVDTPGIRAFGRPIIEFLLPFINVEIVEWSNATISSRGFTFRPIPRFE